MIFNMKMELIYKHTVKSGKLFPTENLLQHLRPIIIDSYSEGWNKEDKVWGY